MDITQLASQSQITATSRCGGSEIEPPTFVQPIGMGTHSTHPLTNIMHSHHQIPQPIAFPYGKCNKNHTLGTSALTLDGCGEFMPSFTSSPSDPTYLNCDACGCHRSYHRNDSDHSYAHVHDVIKYQLPVNHHQIHHLQTSPSSLVAYTPNSPSPPPPPPPPISTSYFPSPPQMFLPYNPCLPTNATNNNQTSIFTTATGSNRTGKKRFRSKFSKEQKTKMQKLAGEIGWKMQNKDEEMILEFCSGIGVTKNVFKVWMHNHKNVNVSNNQCDNNANASGIGGLSSLA